MKFKKRIALLLVVVFSLSFLGACGGGDKAEEPTKQDEVKDEEKKEEVKEEVKEETGGTLVMYTPNSDVLQETIVPAFEEKYGIKVEINSMGTGDMFKRIESEHGNPSGDVAWGGARSTYYNNLDLFEDYTSPNNDIVMDEYKNDTGKVTLYCLDGSCLLVNKELLGDIEVKGYEDLLNPELKGKIAGGEPANSSSAFAQLTNMLLAMGKDYESDAGWDYVRDLVTNMEGKVIGSSSGVHKGVADGEYTVAVTYEDPSVTYIRDGADYLEVIYPVEGTVYLPAGAGIIEGCKNMENAKLFMDFIVSEEGQNAIGTKTTVRPVYADAKIGDYLTPISDINLIYEDYDYVAENRDSIVEKYMDILTSIE